MLAFVTGSTGLLGNNLVRTLLANGHEVRALARSKEKAARELRDTRAQIVLGDMNDVAGFADALRGVDVVFHTAAYFREYYSPGSHGAALDRINVDATLDLVHAAHTRGVARFIDTSSAGLVGLAPDGSPGDETTLPWAGSARNLYLASKQKVEPLLREYSRQTDFFIASALPAWMWGPHDSAPTPSGQLIADALRRRLPPAVPPGGSSVVDARDVAAGMLRIAASGRSGERYILSGPFVNLGDILTMLAALTGNDPPRIRIVFAGALTIAALAETWSRLTGNANVTSVEGIRLMNARIAVSAAKAERKLGATFRPFRETLADAVAWLETRLADPDIGEHTQRAPLRELKMSALPER
jgi:dihydroflavonol-4-reductase